MEAVEHRAFLLDHRDMRDFVSPAQLAAFLRQKEAGVLDVPDSEDVPFAFAVKIAVPVAAGTDELTLERQLAADVRQFGWHLISPGDLPETVGISVLQILVPGAHAEWGGREVRRAEVDRHGTAVVLARDFEQLSLHRLETVGQVLDAFLIGLRDEFGEFAQRIAGDPESPVESPERGGDLVVVLHAQPGGDVLAVREIRQFGEFGQRHQESLTDHAPDFHGLDADGLLEDFAVERPRFEAFFLEEIEPGVGRRQRRVDLEIHGPVAGLEGIPADHDLPAFALHGRDRQGVAPGDVFHLSDGDDGCEFAHDNLQNVDCYCVFSRSADRELSVVRTVYRPDRNPETRPDRRDCWRDIPIRSRQNRPPVPS